jgi:hypothetical protein
MADKENFIEIKPEVSTPLLPKEAIKFYLEPTQFRSHPHD